jgi:hypothetical protein
MYILFHHDDDNKPRDRIYEIIILEGPTVDDW